jgi:ectoine hydroxylase-related dioxygenase (phytanoyl-CoA dioxygenase family)
MPKHFASKAQSRLFHAAAVNPAIAKRTGLKQNVAKEGVAENAGKKQTKLPQHVKKGKK